MTKRITPEYTDSIFEGVEIPDDVVVRRQTAIAKRELSGWHEKKNSKIDQQRENLSKTLSIKVAEDPDYFKKIQAKKKQTEKKLSKKDPNYKTNIQKNKTESTRRFWANASKEYKKEYGLSISKNKNRISPEQAFEIYYHCLEPREEVRSLAYYAKLAKKYNVSRELIMYVVRGDHYAFGGERIKDSSGKHQNIRINHEHINPVEDLKQWRIAINGLFKFTDPNGKEYIFDSFEDAGKWMNSQDNTDSDPYMKCYKKFLKIPANTPTVMKLGFWKNWTLENIKTG